MIKFKPLQCRNENWVFQPDFYLHGTIAKKYNTDLIVMRDDVFNNRVSRFYLEGVALPPTFIDIPEGKHMCEIGNITCVLFTWKRIIFAKNGWTSDIGYAGPMDVWLRQLGLIVDLSDKVGLTEAEIEFNHRNFIL